MTPRDHQTKIFAKLKSMPGEFVSVPDLLKVNGLEDTIEARRVLRCQIWRLRVKHKNSGETIEGSRGSWSRGYRLVRIKEGA